MLIHVWRWRYLHGNRALQIGVWVRGEVRANSCLEVEILARE